MFRSHDLHQLDLWDWFFGVLAPADGSKVSSRDVREKALICCFLSLSWDLDRLVKDQEGDRQVSPLSVGLLNFFLFFQTAIDTLVKRRDSFIGAVTGILAEMASGCETVCYSWYIFVDDDL